MPISLRPITALATRLGASVRDARFVSTREIQLHVEISHRDALTFMVSFRESLIGGYVWYRPNTLGVPGFVVRVDCDSAGVVPRVVEPEGELVTAAHAAGGLWDAEMEDCGDGE